MPQISFHVKVLLKYEYVLVKKKNEYINKITKFTDMRKFNDVYKEKQTKAFESNESKVLLDFKNVYSGLLEKYNCVSYNNLGRSARDSFLFELNKYWNEGSGITKDGEKFIQNKSVMINEHSTVLQKKNFLKNKVKAALYENINGHNMKWKIYDILDEMYEQIKVSSINEILTVDMIDMIIRESFNEVANKFFEEIRFELNESSKPKTKLIIKKKSNKVNEENFTGEESTEEDFEKIPKHKGIDWHGDESTEEDFEKTRDEQENLEDEHPEEGDYGEVYYKIDKYMPDDVELQDEYYDILDDVNLSKEEKIDALTEFFENNAEEETFYFYAPENATFRGFAEYVVGEDAKLNEKAKLGTGARFKKLDKNLKKKGAKDPEALAAYIGREKYGKNKFQKMATAGKK